MIIFMNGRHTFVEADTEPIVWVDSSDATTYTLSGNDVLTLNNKGSLGGAMTLNGSVKFANDGFESLTNADFIQYVMGLGWMGLNSFTIVTTYTFSVQNNTLSFFSDLTQNSSNRVSTYQNLSSPIILNKNNNVNNLNSSTGNYLGVQTQLLSFDVNSLENTSINSDGSILVSNGGYSTTLQTSINILKYIYGSNPPPGANNPLHEFRLYNRAFDLTEMQTLQTELNNKYIQLGSELVVNGDFSNGSTDWILINANCNNGYFEYGVSTGTSSIRQNVFIVGKKYRLKFEVLNYVSGLVGLSSQVTGTGYYPNNVGAFEIEIEPIQSDLVMLGTVDGFTVDNISVKEIL